MKQTQKVLAITLAVSILLFISTLIFHFTNSNTAQNEALANDTSVGLTIGGNRRAGRLYCIDQNNSPVVYDDILQYNINCNGENGTPKQKFKDGTMTIVYDELQDTLGQTYTSGECTFVLVRHGKRINQVNTLRRFDNVPISNGSCQVELTVENQTINYYMVYAEADSGTDFQANTTPMLLYVGG